MATHNAILARMSSEMLAYLTNMTSIIDRMSSDLEDTMEPRCAEIVAATEGNKE